MGNSAKLPVEFANLQLLADQYASSDDLQRQEITEAAGIAEKRNLVDTVWPHLPAINDYLDSHDDNSAHLLGRLAEAACEVAIEIGHPQ